jgi:hypothetical protein
MKSLFKIAILFFSLTLIQCSSDEDSSTSALLYDGVEFKTGSGSPYNTIKNESETNLWLNIREKTDGEAKTISIYANHVAGTHTGTYELRSNLAAPGIATIAIMDDQGNQIAGGGIEGHDGTITISDYGNNTFKITFNDVVLDFGAPGAVPISGSVYKTFTPSNEQ